MPKKSVIYTTITSLKLTPTQQRLIHQRAKLCGVRTSVWMRSVLMQAAQAAARRPVDGYLRIREPSGVTT